MQRFIAISERGSRKQGRQLVRSRDDHGVAIPGDHDAILHDVALDVMRSPVVNRFFLTPAIPLILADLTTKLLDVARFLTTIADLPVKVIWAWDIRLRPEDEAPVLRYPVTLRDEIKVAEAAAAVVVLLNRKAMLTRDGAVTEVLMSGEESRPDGARTITIS